MDKITIPASMTLEKGISIKKYKWKSKNKESIYKKKCRRAFIRFMCKNLAQQISKLEMDKRQIIINFFDNENVEIKRTKNKSTSIQGYSGLHPYIQFIVNKALPKELWEIFEKSNKKTLTFPINLKINLSEWKQLKIFAEDFLLEVEKEGKILMRKAIRKGFKVNLLSKGREYDVGLKSPKNKDFIIGISSHTAKTKSRSKDKIVQKILLDISKMLPYLEKNKKTIPIIISKPIHFENSWSITTNKYLGFYKKKFGFRFLTTEFKKDWEDIIIGELLKI